MGSDIITIKKLKKFCKVMVKLFFKIPLTVNSTVHTFSISFLVHVFPTIQDEPIYVNLSLSLILIPDEFLINWSVCPLAVVGGGGRREGVSFCLHCHVYILHVNPNCVLFHISSQL